MFIVKEKYDHLKFLYNNNYTICYYSGFYSSLRDKIWANGGNFRFSSNGGEEW